MFMRYLWILFFLNNTVYAQTPYPLSFNWKGDVEGFSSFEIRVNLLESDKIINGKGSKLRGRCIFTDSFKRFEIEGEIKNNDFVFNCLDSNNKMLYSFVFPDADGRKKIQTGKWTDANETKSAFLINKDSEDLPKSHTLGFCVALNLRFKILSEDSLHNNFFKKLPKLPFQTSGEGYILDKDAYRKASYYGKDYLEFNDTILLKNNTKEINKYCWQLLPTKSKIPFILEIYSKYIENELKMLKINVLNFKGAKWSESDKSAFPDSTIIDLNAEVKKFEVKDFFICADKIIFYFESKKPLVWLWKEEKFITE